ncbi:MAG: hypothetical protein K5669_08620 [Lachnospiraceae bacterium]|nr:hypothetical protein [Lachnospiraceae bacterium]
MNVLKAIKVAELRKKLSVIPAKIILAAALTVAIYWDTSFSKVWENFQAYPKKYLIMLLIAYGAVSYVYFFIKLMHNWIFGVILSVGVGALVVTQGAKLGDKWLQIALIVMVFGGPVLDILNLLRYHSLKSEVIRAEEEKLEESYGEGYDEGYRKGIREGKRKERRRLRDEDAYYEERLSRSRAGRIGRRGDYEDECENGYYEDEDYEDEYYEDEYYEDEEYDEIDYDDEYEASRYSYDGKIGSDEGGRRDNRKYINGNSEEAAGFFADCKSPAEIKRRYHDLCKVYHPDSGNGSAELFYRIKDEYDRLSNASFS